MFHKFGVYIFLHLLTWNSYALTPTFRAILSFLNWRNKKNRNGRHTIEIADNAVIVSAEISIPAVFN